MPVRPLLFLLAFSPCISFACSLTQVDSVTINLAVSGKNCLRTAQSKQAFSDQLKSAASSMDDEQARKEKRLRSAKEQRLYNLSDLRHQSEFLSARPAPPKDYLQR